MIDLWYLNAKNISQLDMVGMLKTLPADIINEIMRFRNHEDRRLKLFGKLIVQKYHAHMNKKFSWSNWLIAPDGKPFYPGGKEFNISHSGDFVAVAFSDKKIGLDIEKCSDFDISAIINFLHDDEKRFIDSSKDESDAFYTVWTRKEAYLKARGVGIIQGLNNENCLESYIGTEEKWALTSLPVMPGYKLAICSQSSDNRIGELELDLTDFFKL